MDDVIVTKVNSSGMVLDFSTYIGGEGNEEGFDIHLDTNGSIYLTGITGSNNFPVSQGCYDKSQNGKDDIFVMKMNNNGSEVLASTFLGGANVDHGKSLDLDEDGNIYVTGYTWSSNFPTTDNSYDTSFNGGDDDVILSVFNNNCSTLKYSTFIGGSGSDWGLDLKWISHDNIIITGSTDSTNFPTENAYDKTKSSGWNGWDCFLLKINISSSLLAFSTYFGGSKGQASLSVVIDSEKNILISGITASSDFPVTDDAFDKTYNSGASDIFITKFSNNGSNILYSTFLGGDNHERAYDIQLDRSENVYITGYSRSTDFPMKNGSYCTYNKGLWDCIIVKLNISTNDLLYSSYIGGSQNDDGQGLSINDKNEVFIVGNTESTDFPVSDDAFNKTYSGNNDIFVFHLNLSLRPAPPRNLTGEMGYEYVQLEWVEPEDDGDSPIIGYNVYRGLVPKDPPLLMSIGNILEYNDTSALNERGYYYYVTAVNSIGESDPSSIIFIEDNNTPVLTIDNSDEIATTGDPFLFSANISDDIQVTNVWVEYHINNGAPVNLSMIRIYRDHWELTIDIPHIIGNMAYSFSACDPRMNYLRTENTTIDIIDNDLPLIQDLTASIGTTGDSFTFYMEVVDNINVTDVFVRYMFDEDSQSSNITLEGNNQLYSLDIIIPDNAFKMFYDIGALDSSSNYNHTQCKETIIFDNDRPSLISDLSDGEGFTSDDFLFEVKVLDNIGVDQVRVYYEVHSAESWAQQANDPSITENVTLTETETSWSLSFRMPPTPGIMVYSFHFSDGQNNWNETVPISVNIIDNDAPTMIDDASDTVAYTGDRFNFTFEASDNDRLLRTHIEYWFEGGQPEEEPLLYGTYLTGYIIIPEDSLNTLYYRLYLDDFKGNSFSSDIISIPVIDNDRPRIISITHDDHPVGTGSIYRVRAEITDNIDIFKANLFWKQDGAEYERIELERSGSLFTGTIPISENSLNVIGYYIEARDKADNSVSGKHIQITIFDPIPPVIEPIEDITTNTTSMIDIVVNAHDNIGISSIVWEGMPVEVSRDHFHGVIEKAGNYSVRVTVSDEAGNTNTTTFDLTVFKEDYPIDGEPTKTESEKTFHWSIFIIIMFLLIILISSLIFYLKKISNKERNEEIIREDEDRALDDEEHTQNGPSSP
ncbi:hypothetical protein EU522_00195 [Candidatus Thorarchaeota archaeon]|nr:MAG: hypothetical protein EU522_00195 [Candidatus Thorarchaeota archaeon]